MKSWKANGLLEYVQEAYLYIDGALSLALFLAPARRCLL
jgi:hypothetical protein